MRLLLIYPPFCTPTVPPHSTTCLASSIRANSDITVKCLDLNAKFHKQRFEDLYRGLEKAGKSLNAYSGLLEKYSSRARKVHRENNVAMADGGEPELFREFIGMILAERPDVVGFSLVYNSQIFYALKLIRELSEHGIRCVAGGPAAGRLANDGIPVLKDERELLGFLTGKGEFKESYAPDFTQYPMEDYLSREMIYPVRSSFGCNHRACAFCTHHTAVPYREIDLNEIRKVVIDNNLGNLFFIDDTIPARRLAELARTLKPLNVKWWCQTRPTKDLLGLFPELRESGLVSISFGVESGNQEILDSMRKGTRVETIREVLAESHSAGIRNTAFIMFGFPGETESTFTDTVEFLRENRNNLDMVSAAVFGLQKGSHVYDNPDEYGVTDVCEHDTPLGGSIGYQVSAGLNEKQAQALKEKFDRELREMNRLPKIFCLLKEQSLFF